MTGRALGRVYMEIRAAKESELEELFELQRAVFRPNEDALPRYRAYVEEETTYRLDQSRVVVVEGRIVGHLRVWERTIRVRGEKLRAAGIGSLLTLPEYRGRGIARALLEDTENYLLESDYDLGLLFTIIGTPYYEALGWTVIPLPMFEVELSDEAEAPREANRVRHLVPDRDLQAVASIYDQCARDMTGAEVRLPDFWMSGFARYWNAFPRWGVELRGEMGAYLNVEQELDRMWIKEACAAPGCETGYENLAAHLLRTARDAELSCVAGSLPRQHGLVPCLSRMTGRDATWSHHDKMMVKRPNWSSMAEKFGWQVEEGVREEEGPFWRALFGLSPVHPGSPLAAMMRGLPRCEGPFYWWSGIF
jgi:predicted N-acetyltransferase YhbS